MKNETFYRKCIRELLEEYNTLVEKGLKPKMLILSKRQFAIYYNEFKEEKGYIFKEFRDIEGFKIVVSEVLDEPLIFEGSHWTDGMGAKVHVHHIFV